MFNANNKKRIMKTMVKNTAKVQKHDGGLYYSTQLKNLREGAFFVTSTAYITCDGDVKSEIAVWVRGEYERSEKSTLARSSQTSVMRHLCVEIRLFILVSHFNANRIMKHLSFIVDVIECNVDKFRDDYEKYITSESRDPYNSGVFLLNAPQVIRDEIAYLVEEGITIVE